MEIDVLAKLINPFDTEIIDEAQNRFDNLIKPVGSLAKLEEMTTRYAAMLGSADKNKMVYPKAKLLLWTTDITKAAEYMKNPLPSMVMAQNSGIDVQVLPVMALTTEEALLEGALLVKEMVSAKEQSILAFGFADAAIKINIDEFKDVSGYELLETLNNVAVAAMCGAVLQAAAVKTPVMLDGNATCVAALAAMKYNGSVKDYLFAGHASEENDSESLLEMLGLSAPLRLEIKKCKGEGAVLAVSLLNAGIKAYTEMETFAEAGVHVEMKEFSQAEALKKAKQEEK